MVIEHPRIGQCDPACFRGPVGDQDFRTKVGQQEIPQSFGKAPTGHDDGAVHAPLGARGAALQNGIQGSGRGNDDVDMALNEIVVGTIRRSQEANRSADQPNGESGGKSVGRIGTQATPEDGLRVETASTGCSGEATFEGCRVEMDRLGPSGGAGGEAEFCRSDASLLQAAEARRCNLIR